MRMCNRTVTLVNARYNKQADKTVYVNTVLRGVSWFSTMRSSVDSKGLNAANSFTVRIPADVIADGKVYTDPKSYTEAEDASGLFTLNEGDFLVPGEIRSDLAPASIRKIHGAFTILGVTDNRHAPHAPHWKVVGA